MDIDAFILIGGRSSRLGTDKAFVELDGQTLAARAANMNVVVGRHFTRGLQAFFFALAYLGWFIGPWVLIGSTALVLVIVWRRQFASDALAALSNLETSARSKH